MAEPDAGGAAAHATWPDVALWLLNHNGPTYAVIVAFAFLALWKSDTVITAVGTFVNGWRETSLKIRQFDERRTERVKTIAQDISDELARLHISQGH